MSMIDLARASVVERAIYVARDKVIQYKEVAPHIYEGQVKGNVQPYYNVTVNLDHPKKSKCECPFTQGNQRICKHMLAIYYLATRVDLDELEEEYSYDEEEDYDDDYYDFDDRYTYYDDIDFDGGYDDFKEQLYSHQLSKQEIINYFYSLEQDEAIDKLLDIVLEMGL